MTESRVSELDPRSSSEGNSQAASSKTGPNKDVLVVQNRRPSYVCYSKSRPLEQIVFKTPSSTGVNREDIWMIIGSIFRNKAPVLRSQGRQSTYFRVLDMTATHFSSKEISIHGRVFRAMINGLGKRSYHLTRHLVARHPDVRTRLISVSFSYAQN